MLFHDMMTFLVLLNYYILIRVAGDVRGSTLSSDLEAG